MEICVQFSDIWSEQAFGKKEGKKQQKKPLAGLWVAIARQPQET